MHLQQAKHLTFLGVDDTAAARTFYEDILGLRFIRDEAGALVFEMGEMPLRISAVDDFQPQAFTVLGWNVDDIQATANTLRQKGVEPVRYPNMPQDENGIANLGGVHILWIADPAGNILSFTQETEE